MATNNNGHLLDSSGNVAVDFVWGNFPLQPNDVRTNLLDFTLDNHVIAETGWNGFPLYLPGNPGEQISGIPYILVPAVLGLTSAAAVDALKDAGYTAGNITTAAGATNAAIVVTAVARTAGSTTATITASGAGAAFPVGSKVTISALANGNAEFNGTWTVTASATNTISFVSNASTVVTGQTGLTGSVVGLAGTIKVQSVAPAANSIALGTTITITPYAVAS